MMFRFNVKLFDLVFKPATVWKLIQTKSVFIIFLSTSCSVSDVFTVELWLRQSLVLKDHSVLHHVCSYLNVTCSNRWDTTCFTPGQHLQVCSPSKISCFIFKDFKIDDDDNNNNTLFSILKLIKYYLILICINTNIKNIIMYNICYWLMWVHMIFVTNITVNWGHYWWSYDFLWYRTWL